MKLVIFDNVQYIPGVLSNLVSADITMLLWKEQVIIIPELVRELRDLDIHQLDNLLRCLMNCRRREFADVGIGLCDMLFNHLIHFRCGSS